MLDTIAHDIYSVRASGSDLFPPHEVIDAVKRDAITASMESDGWQGAPLVHHGGQLLTGSHRFAAAQSVAEDDYTFEIQLIDLTDAFDLDDDELEYAQDCGIEELTALARQANSDLAIALGLDADG